jgi:hypothetical protein
VSKVAKPKKSAGTIKSEAVELEPDAWPRFERFIKQVAKAGPQHRPSPKVKTKAKRRGQ